MAVIVLLLWAVTAAAGLRLLFTSGLGRRPAPAPAEEPASAMASAAAPAASVNAASADAEPAPAAKPMSARAARQARYDPPTLVRNKNEPIPGLGPLLE